MKLAVIVPMNSLTDSKAWDDSVAFAGLVTFSVKSGSSRSTFREHRPLHDAQCPWNGVSAPNKNLWKIGNKPPPPNGTRYLLNIKCKQKILFGSAIVY